MKIEEKKDLILKAFFEIDKQYSQNEIEFWVNKIKNENPRKTTQKDIQDCIEILILDGFIEKKTGITPSGKNFYLKGGYKTEKLEKNKDPRWLTKILVTGLIGGIITLIIKLSPINPNVSTQNLEKIKNDSLKSMTTIISKIDTVITKISPSAMDNPKNDEFEIIIQERTYDLREASKDPLKKPVPCSEYLLIKKKSPATKFILQYATSGYIQVQKDSNITDVYVHSKLSPDSSYTLRNYHIVYNVSKYAKGEKIEIHDDIRYFNTFFSPPKCGLGDCINLKVLKKTAKLVLSVYYDSTTFDKYERYYAKKIGNEYKEFPYNKDDIKHSTTDSVLIWNISELYDPPVNYKITYSYK